MTYTKYNCTYSIPVLSWYCLLFYFKQYVWTVFNSTLHRWRNIFFGEYSLVETFAAYLLCLISDVRRSWLYLRRKTSWQKVPCRTSFLLNSWGKWKNIMKKDFLKLTYEETNLTALSMCDGLMRDISEYLCLLIWFWKVTSCTLVLFKTLWYWDTETWGQL